MKDKVICKQRELVLLKSIWEPQGTFSAYESFLANTCVPKATLFCTTSVSLANSDRLFFLSQTTSPTAYAPCSMLVNWKPH